MNILKIVSRYILLTVLLLCALPSFAVKQTRTAVADTVFNASQETTQKTIDDFVYGLQTDINGLFDWAFAGTGGQNDSKGKDAIYIQYTDNQYDASTRTGVLTLDVYVLGVAWGRDLKLTTHARTYTNKKGQTVTRVDFSYSGNALKSAYLEFRISPLSAKTTNVESTFSLTFGRFFSIFISDSVWRNVVLWRYKRFIHNMADFAATGQVDPKLVNS